MSYGLEKDFIEYATVVAHIKELLHDYNLPMVPVYKEGTKLYEGKVYIKDNRVVKYLGDNKFSHITDFVPNHEFTNLTKKFIINSSDYDDYTHRYLGNYLRFLRDYYGYDLMSMYNCFNSYQPSYISHSVKLDEDSSYTINTDNDNYTYYIVPVRFNENYTIAIDAQCSYEISCILYTNKFVNKTPDNLIKASLKQINGSQFTKPFIYNTDFTYDGEDIAESCWELEKNLCMLLKLPKRVNSTITILEGNFVECANVVDNTFVTDVRYNTEENYPNVYFGKNSLLRWNDTVSRPFSARLVEYLLGNVIGPLDDIDENIARQQESLSTADGYTGHPGIWTDKLRYIIYKHMLEQDKTKGNNARYGNTISGRERDPRRFIDTYRDLIGYVDKDTELMIRKVGD